MIVLNILEKDNNYKNIKVIGVDTNQVEQYSEHPNVKDRFITSALKKLQKAITHALTVWNNKKPDEIKTWFSGTTVNREQEWIGIAPSETFTESNINNLIQRLTPQLNALSKWWKEEVVAKNSKDTFTAYTSDKLQNSLKTSFNNIKNPLK